MPESPMPESPMPESPMPESPSAETLAVRAILVAGGLPFVALPLCGAGGFGAIPGGLVFFGMGASFVGSALAALAALVLGRRAMGEARAQGRSASNAMGVTVAGGGMFLLWIAIALVGWWVNIQLQWAVDHW